MKEDILIECTGFQWDSGNSNKNWIQHQVSDNECEEVFFNRPIIVSDDKKHSKKETRYYVLGYTDRGRLLFISFTIRHVLIRIISARDMTKNETRKFYEKIKRDTKI